MNNYRINSRKIRFYIIFNKININIDNNIKLFNTKEIINNSSL